MKAVIYTATIKEISQPDQVKAIRAYVDENKIEVIKSFHDIGPTQPISQRSGFACVMSVLEPYDVLLVERVWVMSRSQNELAPILAELKSKNIKLECVSYLWDCVSQSSRRFFDNEKSGPKKELVKAGNVVIAKPKQFFFADMVKKGN